jgi:hypothetical protein
MFVQSDVSVTGPPTPHVTDLEHDKMVFLCALGLSGRQIGEMLERNHGTVEAHLEQLLAHVQVHPFGVQLLVEHNPGGEHPQFTAFQENQMMNEWLLKHFILYKIMESTFASTREISNEIRHDGYEFACGKTKVSEEMQEMHIGCPLTRKNALMTERHKEYRVEFGKEMSQTVDIQQYPILFSDECCIEMNPMRRVTHHIPGIQTPDQFQEFSGFPKKAMVWAAVALGKKSDLEFCDGNVDQKLYREILSRSEIFGQMDETYGFKEWIFQQDGAPAHTAHDTIAFLAERCRLLPGDLQWPAHSPDLNCIEPLWSVLKSKTDVSKCKTSEELFQAAAAAWQKIPQDTVDACVLQFYDKLRAVVALNGESLNGHRDILKEVHNPQVDPDAIRRRLEAEERVREKFVAESQKLFADLKVNPGHKAVAFAASQRLIDALPDYTKHRTGMEACPISVPLPPLHLNIHGLPLPIHRHYAPASITYKHEAAVMRHRMYPLPQRVAIHPPRNQPAAPRIRPAPIVPQ